MSSPNSLLPAIFALWDSVGGGTPTLYLNQVEEGSGYPRAILQDFKETPWQPMTGGVWDVASSTPIQSLATFKFVITVEDNSDDVVLLALLVMSKFKIDAIKVPSSAKSRMTRTGYEVHQAGMRTPANKIAFVAELDYKVFLSTLY